MKREIILDTETTGMDPAKGDKIVEIGCLEIINLMPTGRTFHHYINPEREIPADATAVHGITLAMVQNKPTFLELAADLVEFIGDGVIVAHNAPFDLKFINAELAACGYPAYDNSRVVDTLVMARRQAPGAPASLDALCRRFGIDNTKRTLHGALLDAQLLAEVYLELRGGRQPDLVLGDQAVQTQNEQADNITRQLRPARAHSASEAERAAHTEFLKQLTDPIWQKLQSQSAS
jgi:DNA polymerase III subunit epsilon